MPPVRSTRQKSAYSNTYIISSWTSHWPVTTVSIQLIQCKQSIVLLTAQSGDSNCVLSIRHTHLRRDWPLFQLVHSSCKEVTLTILTVKIWPLLRDLRRFFVIYLHEYAMEFINPSVVALGDFLSGNTTHPIGHIYGASEMLNSARLLTG